MPLYEYQCDACGFRFEVIQRFSDPPVEHCQSCGGPVRKLLSSPAIQFKGSGWYVTDYARKGAKGAGADAESAEKKPKADASSAKTESAAKPAASSSSKD
jgi:putative FmdB family regulatory protein